MKMNEVKSNIQLLDYLDLRIQECDELIAAITSPEEKQRVNEYARGLFEARQAAQQIKHNR